MERLIYRRQQVTTRQDWKNQNEMSNVILQTAGGLATMATMLTSLLYLIVSQTRTYEEGTGSASYDVPVYGRWLLCLLSPTALSLGIDQVRKIHNF